MKKFICCMFVVTALILPGSVQAQGDSTDKSSVTMMEETVVTAGRVKEKKKEITSNITVIGQEEIKNSSATNLGDLLIQKGIGHSHKYPGGLTSIGIRAFRSSSTGIDLEGYVIILLDGHRIATGNASKVMTKNIEKVEIIRGPASVQYGSAAMGGIVNVITKQGKGKPTFFVESMLGSFDYLEKSVGFSGKVNVFDFSGSFSRSKMDDYDTADNTDGDRYYNSGFHREDNTSLNIGAEFLPGNRIGVIYTNYEGDNLGNPGGLYQNDLDDYKDSINRSVNLTYDGQTSEGLFSWKARYYEGKEKSKWFDPTLSNPDFMDDDLPNKYTVDHKGSQAQVSFNQDYLLLTAGFDWMNYETKDDTYSPKSTEYDNPAYFLLAKTRFLEKRLIFSGGLRYDEYEVEIKEGEGGKEDDNNLSPNFGAAYLLTDYLKIRANYGEAFKMPSAQQLAGRYTVFGTNYIGNPNLDPEQSKTYEGGADFSYASLNVSLTYFHTDFKDKIEHDGGWPDRTWINIGKAEMAGFEGELSYDIGTLFDWDFQLKPYASFVRLTKYKDEETHEDLKYTSDWNVSYGIQLSEYNGLSANLNIAYVGKQDIDDWRSAGPPTWTAPVVEKGSFNVANLTISKKIADTEKLGDLTLKAEVENLFDKDYEYVKDYPMPGRSFFLGLRYDY
ncbi:MAG: TonB-dependent receptor [Thermodesulfobacteriota bacterium]|nr:TonB-dependent receptor [Thermodesulfobacteriota bacterium]